MARQVIEDTSWRPDCHVRAPLQGLALRARWLSSDELQYSQAGACPSKAAKLARDLRRELTGWTEDERLEPTVCEVEALQTRQPEGCGLAASRLRASDQVASRQERRNARELNCGRLGVAQIGDNPEECRGE